MSTSVIRALVILELLAASEKPLTLARISDQLEIPKSTAHGILRSLAERRFISADASGAFSIGIKAFETGSAYVRHADLVNVVAPQLVGVTRELEMTSHYAVLDGLDAVYLCKEDPPQLGVQLASSLGARLPARQTAVGKACLAWVPAGRLAQHVAAADGGPVSEDDLAQLRAELAAVREVGFSTDDGETARGIRCVAAPVFDVNGGCGAIGVSYLRDDEVDGDAITATVVEAAARTTELLGGKATP
ncbi:MAG: IclR family transcriptional regulator [Marmoricola sp.]